jgi:hypothetical protein
MQERLRGAEAEICALQRELESRTLEAQEARHREREWRVKCSEYSLVLDKQKEDMRDMASNATRQFRVQLSGPQIVQLYHNHNMVQPGQSHSQFCLAAYFFDLAFLCVGRLSSEHAVAALALLHLCNFMFCRHYKRKCRQRLKN